MSKDNRTMWPLDGGSLRLKVLHPKSTIYVALALGDTIEKTIHFNKTLTMLPLNHTGQGELCIPKIPVPAAYGIKDGDKASLQVMLWAHDGGWVYNVSGTLFMAPSICFDEV